MKKGHVIEVLILLTIAVTGTLAIYSIYYNIAIKPNLYTIRFHDVDSIIKGSPVRFMGIIVGHVRNLKRENDQIACEIVVTKPNTAIPDGSVAKVEYNGLGGSKSIEIMPPKTNDPDIKGIVGVYGLRISDFAEVFGELRAVLICIRQFVETISPENSLGVVKTIAETPDFTENANKNLDKMIEKQKNNTMMINKLFERFRFW